MKIGGPVSFVYDISDTVGEKVPPRFKNIMECHAITTPLGELYSALQYVVKAAGIYYSECPMGLCKYGESRCEFPIKLTYEYRGNSKNTYYSITINSTANETNKSAAILHELAHILCGHLPCGDEKSMKAFKIPRRKYTDKNTNEYEAEKTVEYVCKAMGIDYNADEYLESYTTKNVDKVLSESFILDSSQRIIELMLRAGIDPHLVVDSYK
ncbi:ImmA/IrrE family metallo-endopeptidase [Ruminococcus sp.]|uniref:ImmA/IrrE family metallo-endopeptidase n=1 Tax=Ruminococcus sp. TaxID=41978 RepID=UPI002585FF70|nr:ImmA/IrrE family metallo-endopeptidase [Ruminococcus sp.]MCR5022254.1 ImmA/IrrE family metallo-endopeptidase [Ruminococcus sp.]